MVAPPAIKRLHHTPARDDLFGAHEQVVVAARTRRVTCGHGRRSVVICFRAERRDEGGLCGIRRETSIFPHATNVFSVQICAARFASVRASVAAAYFQPASWPCIGHSKTLRTHVCRRTLARHER